jgi:hypothetical protein
MVGGFVDDDDDDDEDDLAAFRGVALVVSFNFAVGAGAASILGSSAGGSWKTCSGKDEDDLAAFRDEHLKNQYDLPEHVFQEPPAELPSISVGSPSAFVPFLFCESLVALPDVGASAPGDAMNDDLAAFRDEHLKNQYDLPEHVFQEPPAELPSILAASAPSALPPHLCLSSSANRWSHCQTWVQAHPETEDDLAAFRDEHLKNQYDLPEHFFQEPPAELPSMRWRFGSVGSPSAFVPFLFCESLVALPDVGASAPFVDDDDDDDEDDLAAFRDEHLKNQYDLPEHVFQENEASNHALALRLRRLSLRICAFPLLRIVGRIARRRSASAWLEASLMTMTMTMRTTSLLSGTSI